jgi:hypothetical protein
VNPSSSKAWKTKCKYMLSATDRYLLQRGKCQSVSMLSIRVATRVTLVPFIGDGSFLCLNRYKPKQYMFEGGSINA